jgi:microcystin-dependent protein
MALPIGAVIPYFGTVAPPGFLECVGSDVSVTDEQYAHLLRVIPRDRHGAYKLPDLRGRTVVGPREDTPGKTPQNIGDRVGSDTVKILTEHLPSHLHDIALNGSHSHGVRCHYGALGNDNYHPDEGHKMQITRESGCHFHGNSAPSNSTHTAPIMTTADNHTHVCSPTGGGIPLPIESPALVLMWIIKYM